MARPFDDAPQLDRNPPQAEYPTPWLASYPDGVPARLQYPDIPAWRLLEQAARDFPERDAYRYYDERATYAEVWDTARRTATLLRHLGLEPGERVGLLMPNLPEYITALNGIWLAGGVAVAISPLMVTDEVSSLIERTDCRFVIALDMLAPLVFDGEHQPEKTLLVTLRDCLPRWQQLGYVLARRKQTGRWWISQADHFAWLDEELSDAEPIDVPADTDGATSETAGETGNRTSRHNRPAYILPTGGTTAAPKAVVLSHRNLVANAWQQFHWSGAQRGEHVLLAVLPFFHSYGLSASLLTGVTMGATLVIHHRFSAWMVPRLIEEHRPTIMHAVPAMLVALNERLRKKPADLSSLRWCISGGSTLSREVAEEFTSHSGAIVVEGFGLSEAGPVTHVGPLDGTNRIGSIGLPLPDTEARIVDVQTGMETLPPGAVGELVVRGPQVMLGYLDNPRETARAVRDGWLFTGDLATCDEDGFFRIVDRKKDMIITSGFNVYPGDVEAVLKLHPDVTDAAVVGVPDDRRGQLVKAFVVLRRGVSFDRKSFDDFCRKHLSAQKRPREFEVVGGDLPRNFLGKVLRRHLRSAAEPVVPLADVAASSGE